MMFFASLTQIKHLLGTLSAAACVLILSTCFAQPIGQDGDKIRIVHRAMTSGSIPALGTPMRINVELINTFDIDAKLRLIGAKDGRFIDIAFPRGALNDIDRPVFSIEIPSPVAVMTYQFVVQERDGSLSSSEKFVVKRECIQNFTVAVPENTQNTEFRREVSTLVAQAKTLERDTVSLEASLKLIEDMRSSLAN